MQAPCNSSFIPTGCLWPLPQRGTNARGRSRVRGTPSFGGFTRVPRISALLSGARLRVNESAFSNVRGTVLHAVVSRSVASSRAFSTLLWCVTRARRTRRSPRRLRDFETARVRTIREEQESGEGKATRDGRRSGGARVHPTSRYAESKIAFSPAVPRSAGHRDWCNATLLLSAAPLLVLLDHFAKRGHAVYFARTRGDPLTIR